MLANGLDPESPADRDKATEAALDLYYRKTTEAAQALRSSMPIFHNSGHIARGNREILKYFSHIEMESLPTGGWGYDDFPMSAKYVANLGMDFMGMTGKFHTTWGEFGGYKHPNALRYECAAMLAFNSRVRASAISFIPRGNWTNRLTKTSASPIAKLRRRSPGAPARRSSRISRSSPAKRKTGRTARNGADEGAARVLLEEHFLFELVDRQMSLDGYKLVILPDDIRIDEPLNQLLDAYLAAGGKLLLTGSSGFWKDREEFAFDVGADVGGPSPFSPDYILPAPDFRADFVDSPLVMYLRSHRLRATSG